MVGFKDLNTFRLRVIAITQLDGFVPTGCQTSCYVMNERSSGNVLNFWTTISKKRRINITRADGVLRMLEGTTAEQQHVFNIQQQDLLGLYQPSDDDLFEEDHQPKTPSMRPLDHVDIIPRQIRTWLVDILSSEKDVFESAITASLNPTPAHPFQQVRKTILYDLIVPLFKAIQSVYREYSFNWIEVQASCIKDTKEWFPEFDFTLNKVF
ncbi:4371_t:CDS:2 [Rhizophagus irregularis]|nr:4371_t:CDS:2 [Rhizophagus irregularis]